MALADDVKIEQRKMDDLTFYLYDIDSPVRGRGAQGEGGGCERGRALATARHHTLAALVPLPKGGGVAGLPHQVSTGLLLHPPCARQVNRYLASISVKFGKVYALFVKSPAKVGGRRGALCAVKERERHRQWRSTACA